MLWKNLSFSVSTQTNLGLSLLASKDRNIKIRIWAAFIGYCKNRELNTNMLMLVVDASTAASVKHCFDVLPGVQARVGVQRWRRWCDDDQFEMTAPWVEVGGVRVIVDSWRWRVRRTMIVEDELVGREERVTVTTADALGSRTGSWTHPHNGHFSIRPMLLLHQSMY